MAKDKLTAMLMGMGYSFDRIASEQEGCLIYTKDDFILVNFPMFTMPQREAFELRLGTRRVGTYPVYTHDVGLPPGFKTASEYMTGYIAKAEQTLLDDAKNKLLQTTT